MPAGQDADKTGGEEAQLVVWRRLSGRWRIGLEQTKGRFRSAESCNLVQALTLLSSGERQVRIWQVPCLSSQPCCAHWSDSHADFTYKVVGVSDGDTVTVLHNGKGERIRLHGIDCPEKRQAFGKRAKQFTSKLVFGETVTVQVVDRDRYGRTVGVVLLPDGRSLNHELVKAGFAWWYWRYTPDDETLAQLEREAWGAKRGLWADPEPVPPWEWRIMRKRYR